LTELNRTAYKASRTLPGNSQISALRTQDRRLFERHDLGPGGVIPMFALQSLSGLFALPLDRAISFCHLLKVVRDVVAIGSSLSIFAFAARRSQFRKRGPSAPDRYSLISAPDRPSIKFTRGIEARLSRNLPANASLRRSGLCRSDAARKLSKSPQRRH